jgi:hypothetical protein
VIAASLIISGVAIAVGAVNLYLCWRWRDDIR